MGVKGPEESLERSCVSSAVAFESREGQSTQHRPQPWSRVVAKAYLPHADSHAPHISILGTHPTCEPQGCVLHHSPQATNHTPLRPLPLPLRHTTNPTHKLPHSTTCVQTHMSGIHTHASEEALMLPETPPRNVSSTRPATPQSFPQCHKNSCLFSQLPMYSRHLLIFLISLPRNLESTRQSPASSTPSRGSGMRGD